MSLKRTAIVWGIVWVGGITALHGALNQQWFKPAPKSAGASADGARAGAAFSGPKFSVGYIPVTCHLTCPVTNFINKATDSDEMFKPMRFNGFPEIKEMFLSNRLEATFILAPLAMSLREQGVPIKIVYLGHRDGTALVVNKDSTVRRVEDLRGKKVAIPNRYSNQRIMLHRALKKRGMTLDDVILLEMSPPDMPISLQTGAVDAITSGEPFMAQTELDGYGRVLYQAKDEWPGFISCVLAVREDVIQTRRADVQALVDGIARSGKWIDQSMDNRMHAADVSATQYYNQDPKLLRHVLSKPVDRVRYSNLVVHRPDFEEIERLGIESGVLTGKAKFDDYADPSFVRDNNDVKPWDYEPKKQ
ncbi:MAG TPA: ABC transporter substrate-binding protein [Tepidisphaeraceae bacterium]|nr:ABC transporter substrate-binding protein [Tepidisphaeraceae bacterium]